MNQKPTSDMPAEIDMPQPGLGRRLVRNVLWNFGGQLWALALAFFTMPYIVGKLGTDAYGLLMTVGIVTNYLWFMDLGLGQATVKYAAEHAARNEWEEVNRIFWTSLVSYLVLGTLAALILVAIAPLCVTSWFQIPVDLQDEALSVFYLSAAGFVIGMVNNAPASIPRALQRFDIVNKVSVAVGSSQTLLTVALLAFGYSVKHVVIGNLVIAGVSLAINLVMVRRLSPQWVLPNWHLLTFKKLLKFGSFVTVSGIVGPILVHLEKLVLASIASMGAVAFYAVPYNLTSRASLLPGALSSTLFPFFSGRYALGQQDVSTEVNLRASRYITLLLMPAALLLVLFGEEFLQLWMGLEFARESTTALQILAIAMLVNAAAWSPFALLQASGRPDLTAKFHTLELTLHVPVTLLCVHYWGVTGAALAWLIRVAIDTALIWGATIRLNGLDWKMSARQLFNRTVWIILAGGVIFGILKAVFKGYMSSLLLLIVLGGSLMIVSALVGWIWGVKREERQLIWRALGIRESARAS